MSLDALREVNIEQALSRLEARGENPAYASKVLDCALDLAGLAREEEELELGGQHARYRRYAHRCLDGPAPQPSFHRITREEAELLEREIRRLREELLHFYDRYRGRPLPGCLPTPSQQGARSPA